MPMAYRVLFHVNEASSEKHQAAVRTVRNLLKEMPEAEVEIVVQGDALPMALAQESTLVTELRQLVDQGVRVAVCHNTMKARAVSADALIPGLEVVPSAVGELVRRQQEGMAYIKP